MPLFPTALLALAGFAWPAAQEPAPLTYPIVDTQVGAEVVVHPPKYQRNDDGTVSDLVTGLTWTQPSAQKMSFAEALAGAKKCEVGGFDDWRLPTIKELYSLILFSGVDPNPNARNERRLTPFLDRSVFTEFQYGNTSNGERIIDSQFATATEYVSTTMNSNATMFGVNFADGRIKGYPKQKRRSGQGGYYVMYVRGNADYGRNQFHDNGDGTVSDLATGLMWMKADAGDALDWNQAQEFANGLKLAGHSDWRLPTAKELHSIVDYTRSPDTSKSAAIDPVFTATEIVNEGGERDWGQYWTSTQHLKQRGSESMVYICFGRSLGFMKGRRGGEARLMDVHGAGAQRSEAKTGDPSRFPTGRGPQGDVVRFFNMVRCVRIMDEVPIAVEIENEEAKPARTRKNRSPKIDKPNFILILADDLGWTGLSVPMIPGDKSVASDFYQTPNIAKLAEQGMRFSRSYSPAALCTPSRAAILTGKSPARLHITTPGGGRQTDDGGGRSGGRRRGGNDSQSTTSRDWIGAQSLRNLPEEEITIAEALAKRDYVSAYFGKWHLGRSGPDAHGFDYSDGPTTNTPPNSSASNPKDINGITDRAIQFMEQQAEAGKPFYLQLSHYAVHGPTQSSEQSHQRFQELSAGRRHNDAAYAGMTYDLDLSVGEILAAIDDLGLSKNTYVVFYSDNGAQGNRRKPNNVPLNSGKGGFLEGGIRVPLVIRGPGIEAGSHCQANVIGQDLFPTFCDLAGAKSKSAQDGLTLTSLFEKPSATGKHNERPLLFHFPHYGQSPKQTPQSALILDDFKLIRDYENGVDYLYDLSKDLGERSNLISEQSKDAQRMTSLLEQVLEDVGAQMLERSGS